MARPLRIEFAGALYHVTARGNAQAGIFADDADRQQFVNLLGAHLGVSYGTVSRAVKLLENRGQAGAERSDGACQM